MTHVQKYETVIGLEVHAQLKTASKIFCKCSTRFGAAPNSCVCPVCLGLPGALPVLNKTAVEFAIKMGVATNCKISPTSIFARKNYFYPDLPKGYQISQSEKPLCENGFLEIEIGETIRRIGISRIHLEEDAGKSIHDEKWVKNNETLIDLNRCGVPLIEIVSCPEINSAAEARLYLTKLKQLICYLEICDGNMEEGSLRCDANISIRKIGDKNFGTKTELKNLNSFRAVEKALNYEQRRQIQLLQNDDNVQPTTLMWNDRKNIAVPIRSKEMAQDYRYFTEPDLLPLKIGSAWVDSIAQELPELPEQKSSRLIDQYKISNSQANVLTENKHVADYFEKIVNLVHDVDLAANWIIGEALHFSTLDKFKETNPVSADRLAELLVLVSNNSININTAKDVFKQMIETGESAKKIVADGKLNRLSDINEIKTIIEMVIRENLDEAAKYRAGNLRILDFLVGQAKRATAGTADPKIVNQLLKERLSIF